MGLMTIENSLKAVFPSKRINSIAGGFEVETLHFSGTIMIAANQILLFVEHYSLSDNKLKELTSKLLNALLKQPIRGSFLVYDARGDTCEDCPLVMEAEFTQKNTVQNIFG